MQNDDEEKNVIDVESLKKELKHLTNKMDVPDYNKTKIIWLLKNLHVRNSENKNYDKVINICEELKKRGVN
jgi:biopolymer transport protein ExbD